MFSNFGLQSNCHFLAVSFRDEQSRECLFHDTSRPALRPCSMFEDGFSKIRRKKENISEFPRSSVFKQIPEFLGLNAQCSRFRHRHFLRRMAYGCNTTAFHGAHCAITGRYRALRLWDRENSPSSVPVEVNTRNEIGLEHQIFTTKKNQDEPGFSASSEYRPVEPPSSDICSETFTGESLLSMLCTNINCRNFSPAKRSREQCLFLVLLFDNKT